MLPTIQTGSAPTMQAQERAPLPSETLVIVFVLVHFQESVLGATIGLVTDRTDVFLQSL